MFEKKPKVKGKIFLLPLESICSSPYQPRRTFDDNELDSLARSIAHNGLLVPISVRAVDGGYQLIAGERRLMACRRLGYTEIPAMVEALDENASAVLTFIENIHRQGLNCFEEALGIKNLLITTGLTQSRVCALLDMPQPTVANKLRLLRLSESVQQAVTELGLGERIARGLLKLEDEQLQLKACREISSRGLTAAAAERYIEELMKTPVQVRHTRAIFRDYRFLFSTVDKAVDEIRRTGIEVVARRTEEEDCLCYTIRIPKQKKAAAQAGKKAIPLRMG
ncbi:MAG: ParB/RepB/Spo0J family partition protein [Angelakisella sp.]